MAEEHLVVVCEEEVAEVVVAAVDLIVGHLSGLLLLLAIRIRLRMI